MRAVAAIAAFVAVVAVRTTATTDTGFPLVVVPQGAIALTVRGAHVFVAREGEIVTAFSPSAQNGSDTIVWCPGERVFVSPQHFELFDIGGHRVDGPAVRDLTRFPVKVSPDLRIFVDVAHPIVARTRSSATISGDVGDRYSRARAGAKAGFCLNPVR